MSKFTLFSRVLVVINLLVLACAQVDAQISPDSTLGKQRSIVRPNQTVKGGSSDRIEGGVRRGASLFHSFGQFNINEGQAAYFTNPVGVKNILSRVTGDSRSIISGRLGVLGNANLFLINPNGITFGPNASLDINGSFLPTTASSVLLPDNTEFSAINPQPVPLLEVNVPIGLNFTHNPGSIEVQGPGHNLIRPGNPFAPPSPNREDPAPAGLALQPGHTLALVGGRIIFSGGIATAPSGRIEIGSVDSGQVLIEPSTSEGFKLSYPEVRGFQNVLLEKSSLLSASGYRNGNIQIFANNLELTDASLVLVSNQGLGPLGSININASNSLLIIGTTKFTKILSGNRTIANGIVSNTIDGKGSDIDISTERLVLKDAAGIESATYGSGDSGNTQIKASESIQVFGNSPLNPTYPSGSFISAISAGTGSPGDIFGISGDIFMTTKELFIKDGGIISSSTYNYGKGGDVNITAFNSINLAGYTPAFIPSIISSITFSSGPGGNLVLDTKDLTILNGGRVDASTLASGSAGNLEINAFDSIHVSGTVPGSLNPSLIIASANLVDPSVRQALGLPDAPTGLSGNIAIDTGKLSVTDGAQVTVRNDGPGDAGDLQINANYITLNNQGGITASTAGGQGGDIALQNTDLLLMRGNSNISASAGGTSTGGNITINSNLLTALENSDISADAIGGDGGRVRINAQGIFGTEAREQKTLESDITATSQLGPQFSGTLEINNPELDFAKASSPPASPPESPEVASVCQGQAGAALSEFVKAGTGGTPPSPTDLQEPSSVWVPQSPQAKAPTPVVDAQAEDDLTPVQGWIIYPDGTMRFTTQPGIQFSPQLTSSCSTMKGINQ